MATKPEHKIKYSSQEIDNLSFDEQTGLKMVLPVGSDGQNIQIPNADNLATIIVESGASTYIAKAAPNSANTDSVWQAYKIDETSGTIITWADGNANFDNQANDLASLTYS